jgi:hypothetical protein
VQKKTATQLRVITPQLILCKHILNKNKRGTNSQKWDSPVSLTEHKEDGFDVFKRILPLMR